jgi:hypothetical protein
MAKKAMVTFDVFQDGWGSEAYSAGAEVCQESMIPSWGFLIFSIMKAAVELRPMCGFDWIV